MFTVCRDGYVVSADGLFKANVKNNNANNILKSLIATFLQCCDRTSE